MWVDAGIPVRAGVYAMICKISGRFYIGQCQNMYLRRRDHLNTLRLNCHPNPRLSSDYAAYGPDAFRFEPIEYIDDLQTRKAVEWKLLIELTPTGLLYNKLTKSMRDGKPCAAILGPAWPIFPIRMGNRLPIQAVQLG